MRDGKDKYKEGVKYKEKEDYALTIANNILLEAQGGFDGEIAAKAILNILKAMENNALLLRDEAERLLRLPEDERNMDFQAMSRSFTQMGKGIDDLYRLQSFAKGRPDSRPDLGNGFLQGLTDSQIEQVNKWVNENQAFTKAKVINGDSQD